MYRIDNMKAIQVSFDEEPLAELDATEEVRKNSAHGSPPPTG
jgi:hypothetical protein